MLKTAAISRVFVMYYSLYFLQRFFFVTTTSNTVMPRRATLEIYSFRYLKCKTTFQSVFTHKLYKGIPFPHKSLFLSEISCVLKRLFGLPLPVLERKAERDITLKYFVIIFLVYEKKPQ